MTSVVRYGPILEQSNASEESWVVISDTFYECVMVRGNCELAGYTEDRVVIVCEVDGVTCEKTEYFTVVLRGESVYVVIDVRSFSVVRKGSEKVEN
jgi:hypothetical protein